MLASCDMELDRASGEHVPVAHTLALRRTRRPTVLVRGLKGGRDPSSQSCDCSDADREVR
jgi:hypothetical protein